MQSGGVEMRRNIICLISAAAVSVSSLLLGITAHAEDTGSVDVIDKYLQEYSYENMTDCYPKYYGVRCETAGGVVTLAYAEYDDAMNSASSIEFSQAEKQPDGTYLYKDTQDIGSTQNTVYYDETSFDEAVEVFAGDRVEEKYFDLSDPASYVTVKDYEMTDIASLISSDLPEGVIIFPPGEKEKLCKKGAFQFPLVSPKPYAYSVGDAIETGLNDFSLDAKELTVFAVDTDLNKVKRTYSLDPDKNIGEQLTEKNCNNSVVDISAVFADGSEHSGRALYITNDEYLAISLSCTNDDNTQKYVFDRYNRRTIDADYFRIIDLNDRFDTHPVVKMIRNDDADSTCYFTNEDLTSHVFSAEGKYTLTVLNRLGQNYSFDINVTGNSEVVLEIEGESEDISTVYGADIELPKPRNKGHELIGFEDSSGRLYADEIGFVPYKEDTILKPKWRPRQYSVTYKDENGCVISEETVDFGEEIMLPLPEISPNRDFVGWELNGELLGVDYTHNIESNVVLTISAEDKPWYRSRTFAMVSILVIIAVIAVYVKFVDKEKTQ